MCLSLAWAPAGLRTNSCVRTIRNRREGKTDTKTTYFAGIILPLDILYAVTAVLTLGDQVHVATVVSRVRQCTELGNVRSSIVSWGLFLLLPYRLQCLTSRCDRLFTAVTPAWERTIMAKNPLLCTSERPVSTTETDMCSLGIGA